MKLTISLILFCLLSLSCVTPKEEKTNDDQYVILISIDGFSSNYVNKYEAVNLKKMAKIGVSAEGLIPPYPTKTFPSHYSIATGLYPENHGIVANSFYDSNFGEYYSSTDRKTVENGKWYNGKPIWCLAQENELTTAAYFWVGSEALIDSCQPTYYYNYDTKTTNKERFDKIIEWLELPIKERPRLITVYFSDVDQIGHKYGPNSKETENTVNDIDKQLGELINRLDNIDLDINLIVVSDHGMLELKQSNKIILDSLLEWEGIKRSSNDAFSMIYENDSNKVDSLYKYLKKLELEKFTTYKKEEIPDELHFKNNHRIGDLILIPSRPYFFGNDNYDEYWGAHGFIRDNNPEMDGIFFAQGPVFKSNIEIAPFENINIYPLIATILHLPYDTSSIDGRLNVTSNLIK